MKPKFSPTTDQIRMAEAVFTAMIHEALIRPIVENYENQILQKHQFKIAQKWVDHGYAERIILNRKDSCLLSLQDSAVYFAECFAARDAANLKVENPENCPLLVAEHLRIVAENELLKAISSTPGLSSLGSRSLTLDKRKRAIELTLSLLAPFCDTSDSILRRYAQAA